MLLEFCVRGMSQVSFLRYIPLPNTSAARVYQRASWHTCSEQHVHQPEAEEVKLHGSISSVFYLTDDTAGYYISAFALTDICTAHSASVRGYAWCQEAPDYITCPFILHRTTNVDFIVVSCARPARASHRLPRAR